MDGGATASPAASTQGYRPALDGIRALAVYLVLAYHAGVDPLAGGFLGVDVFFVLSGYLVTRVLTRDLDGEGRIRLGRFYARRMRRLLPAATVVLVTTAVVVVALDPPATWDDAESGIRAASVYVSNWFFAARATDYFAADVTTNPVLHFWSLSVEEQFYLAWPLVLLAVHRAARVAGTDRRSRRLVQGTVAAGAVASLLWAWHLAGTDLSRAYYGTDTRAYQLLAGALLGLAPGILRRLAGSSAGRTASTALAVAAPIALVALASDLWSPDPIERGALATVGALLLIAAVEVAPTGLGGRLLGAAPIAYLGRISYGVYLWHWLVVLVLDRETDLSTVPTTAVTALVATAAAAASHHLLEQPVRTWSALDRHRGPVIAGGLAVSLAVAVVIVPAIFAVGRRDQGPATIEGGNRADGAPVVLDWRAAQRDEVRPPECQVDRIETCTVVEGDGPTLLLLGDSHAAMFTPMLSEVARDRGAELVVAAEPTCPWPRGVFSAMTGPVCEQAQAEWYGPIIEQVDPDVVVMSSRVLDDPALPTAVYGEGTSLLTPGTDALDDFVAERTEATIEELRSDGRTVVVIEPIPLPGEVDQDPIECLSAATDASECTFGTNRDPLPQERVLRELAEEGAVVSIDLDEEICPSRPTCDVVVDGQIAFRDRSHITGTFSRGLSGPMGDLLVEAGVV